VRHGEHPLPERRGGKHAIRQVGGPLRHAAPTAARAEAAALAGEGHEALETAAVAAHAGEAVGEHAAGEKPPQLGLDEGRHADPVAMDAGGL